MSDRYRPGFSLCLLALFLLLAGCAAIKGGNKTTTPDAQPAPVEPPPAAQPAPRPPAPPPKPQPQPPVVQKPPTPPAPEPAQPSPSTKYPLGVSEYRKALDKCGVRYRKHPRDQALTAEYVKGIEGTKSAADKAYDEQEYGLAGRIYDLLLKRFGEFKDFAQTLTFSKAYLNQRLSLCKKTLSTQGFQEYRKGNLSQAIRYWQDLLAIDPKNEDNKKALSTASEQQKNLQTKK